MCDHDTARIKRIIPSFLQSLRNRFAIALVALLAVPGARGQAVPGGLPEAGGDYSQEAFVLEKFRTVATFENDGTSTRTTTGAVRIQSEAGVQHWGVLSAGYSTTTERVEIGYVRVRKTDGTVVETPADSAQDVTSDVMRAAPMYSDYHEKHVAVRGLGVGDILEYQITVRLYTPLIAGQFWYAYDFEKDNIALDEEVEVNVPNDREVKVKSPDLSPVVTVSANRRIYAWKTANHESRKQEVRREFPPPSILLSSFKSWEEVGSWWKGLEQDRVAPTPEIRAKTDELTHGITGREDKIRALYSFVATHFRYISISFGIGRYQPHSAFEVLNNEYGDCKDKHTLLASLLQAAGIDAYPVLMNSSRHIDLDVPSPGQFDHVITAVPESPNSDKFIWLDTTAEVAPFSFLLFQLRDKQGLVIPTSQPSRLMNTPADPPFKNFRHLEIDAKLSDDGVLEGTMQRSYRGDSEVLLRGIFRQYPQSQWKDVAQGLAQGMGFGGDVSEVDVGSPEDTSAPFHFSNKYTRKDYPDWANHRIAPPLGIVGVPEIKDDEKRTQPILLGGREEITDIAKVKLPEGYAPRLLPPVDEVRDFAEFHASYTFNDGVFVAKVTMFIKQPEVPLSELKEYQSFQKAISDNQNRYTELVLTHESLYALSPSSNPEATRLVQEAQAAGERHDLGGAISALQHAVELDDHFKGAWVMLGTLQLAQGRTNEGLTALHKAIDVDPKDTQTYRVLGQVYLRMHRPEDAVAVWRDLLKLDPGDAAAHTNLGTLLVDLKRYKEAVAELEAASTLAKPTSAARIALANAYIGTGSLEKAAGLLKDAANASLDPVIWNDAAYYLADNHLNLPDAQRYAEQAVKSIESETADVHLDTLARADLLRMEQLASYWDTLGWVYFQQGNLVKAQNYLEAAWNLEQTRVDGEHLTQVYEKQGKREAADHQHLLAQAVLEPEQPKTGVGSPVGKPSPPGVRQRAAAEEVSELRRTKLGKLSNQRGSAEFFVLLAPGGRVEDVKFINGVEQIRPLSKAVASLKFKSPLPDEVPTKLVRRGVLVCPGPGFDCDFTLFTVDTVTSTE
jgi:tetratricopeptide (TPR) repeat protein